MVYRVVFVIEFWCKFSGNLRGNLLLVIDREICFVCYSLCSFIYNVRRDVLIECY